MWVKICGNTRLEDCLLAAQLGANAVGFVFAAGKRTVQAAQVAAITAKLPKTLERWGVFTVRDEGTLVATAREAGLTGIQLHGALDLGLLARLHARGEFRVMQMVPWFTDVTAKAQQAAFAAECDAVDETASVDAVLIDSRTRNASGGTGVAFDWQAARGTLQTLQSNVVVAGGLTPENVADAIEVLQPWGVDVSSGVESAPGVKDADKLRAFLQAARSI